MIMMGYNLARTMAGAKLVVTEVTVVPLVKRPEMPWRDIVLSKPVVITVGVLTLGVSADGVPRDALPSHRAVDQGLRALAAICMLVVGLHLAGFPSAVKALESVGAPFFKRLLPFAARFVPLRTPWHALLLGGVWGLMPCGLLYGALALATAAESPALGAATMAAFGVATLPVMLAMSAVAQSVSRNLAQRWVRRAAGAVVLAFGLWSTAGVAAQAGLGTAFGLAPHHHCCPTPRP